MGHKRKRQEDSTVTEEPAPKKQATEKEASTNAAERRQKRSERKSKKAQEAKQNASRNGKKNKEKHEPKSKARANATAQASASPELVKANLATTGTDNLAQGQDFISLAEPANLGAPPIPSLQPPFKKAKKSSPRSERKKAKAEKAALAGTENGPTEAAATTTAKDSKTAADPRFIVFVGNLPFSTTTAQITSHFRKLTPTSIRHPTDKATGKSKGYAFLEFDNYSSMKTCLKVYHHSLFDPERTSKLPDSAFDENGLEIVKPGQENRRGSGRRINVELTAGGGGKSEDRKEKIRLKNTRLEEQRDRRREAEMKAEKAKSKKNRGVSDANATEIQEKEDDGRGAIHPSRLKRVAA